MSNREKFEALVAHLHDAHGLDAEKMADDEVSNGTDPKIIAEIQAMTREQALDRLPYHHFMNTTVPRDSDSALASARITHQDEIANGDTSCDYKVDD